MIVIAIMTISTPLIASQSHSTTEQASSTLNQDTNKVVWAKKVRL